MKQGIIFALFLSGALALSACASSPATRQETVDEQETSIAQSNNLPNTFSENGLTFKYPKNWTKTEGSNGTTYILTSPTDIPFSTVNAGASYTDAPFPNPFEADSIDEWSDELTATFESIGITITSDPILEDDGHLISYVASGAAESDGMALGAFIYFGFTPEKVYSIVTGMDGDTTTDAADEIAEMYTTIVID